MFLIIYKCYPKTINDTMAQKTDDPSTVTDTITVTGKPSGYKASSYYDYKKTYTKTWKNWCPQCKKVGCLTDNPKNKPEHELTCDKSKGGCDADYDVCTGGDKQTPPRAYLVDANGKSNSNGNIDTSVGDAEGTSSGTSEGGTSSGGGAVSIPDRTFYGTIKQICGATDSIFITANNMAYLLTIKDYYYFREKYLDLIPTIEENEVLENSMEQEWNAQPMYTVVEVKYKDGTFKYGHDALVAQYGEKPYHYDLPDDSYEVAKSKAAALLSAQVRDYAMDIKLTCLYDENITAGSWVKLKKSLVHSSKMKNNENSSDYDLFFVQAYSINWRPTKTIAMDLFLKYAPMSPEDPINATLGGIVSAATSVDGAEEVPEEIKAKVAEIIGNETDLLERAKLITQWGQDNVNHADYFCMKYKTLPATWAALPNLNCADSSHLACAMLNTAGIEATVVHAPKHFWVVFTVNGEEFACDFVTSGGVNKVASSWMHYWNSKSYTKTGNKPSC